MTVKEQIESKLASEFEPDMLEVIDESHKHRGHVGARPEGETHFHVNMQAKAFAGVNRVARQRMVYKTLSAELEGPVHALSLKLDATE